MKGRFLIVLMLFVGLTGLRLASVEQIAQGAEPIAQFSNLTLESWKASAVNADCTGPSDASGRFWYAPDFDESQWVDVLLPEVNTIPPSKDRYYRLNYSLVTVSAPVKIQFSSLALPECPANHW